MRWEGRAAARRLRVPEDLSREGRQLSEEERSNLPPDCARCARSLGGEKVGQNFPGPREPGRQEMRAAGRGGRKGPCGGRGRSRRRRPRLPHPRARRRRGGPEAEGARGARPGAGRNAPGRRARRGGWAAGGGGGVCAGERRNLEPELPGWRRAGLGDVTALESEECRAAGAPCAGPGEVAHFWCGGFGKCSKVRTEEGGRVKLPGVRDVGVEKERRPPPARPTAAPGGGRDWGRKGKKSHLDLRKPQGRGRGRDWSAPAVSKDGPSHLGDTLRAGRPQAATAWRGDSPGESKVASRSRQSQGSLSETPGVSASWIWGLRSPPPPAPRNRKSSFCVLGAGRCRFPGSFRAAASPRPAGWALGGNFLSAFRGGVSATQLLDGKSTQPGGRGNLGSEPALPVTGGMTEE